MSIARTARHIGGDTQSEPGVSPALRHHLRSVARPLEAHRPMDAGGRHKQRSETPPLPKDIIRRARRLENQGNCMNLIECGSLESRFSCDHVAATPSQCMQALALDAQIGDARRCRQPGGLAMGARAWQRRASGWIRRRRRSTSATERASRDSAATAGCTNGARTADGCARRPCRVRPIRQSLSSARWPNSAFASRRRSASKRPRCEATPATG